MFSPQESFELSFQFEIELTVKTNKIFNSEFKPKLH